jgi:hypothetical protein
MTRIASTIASLLASTTIGCASAPPALLGQEALVLGSSSEDFFQQFEAGERVAIHHGVQGGYHVLCSAQGEAAQGVRDATVTVTIDDLNAERFMSTSRSIRTIEASADDSVFVVQDLRVFLLKEDAVTGTEVRMQVKIDDGRSRFVGEVKLQLGSVEEDL